MSRETQREGDRPPPSIQATAAEMTLVAGRRRESLGVAGRPDLHGNVVQDQPGAAQPLHDPLRVVVCRREGRREGRPVTHVIPPAAQVIGGAAARVAVIIVAIWRAERESGVLRLESVTHVARKPVNHQSEVVGLVLHSAWETKQAIIVCYIASYK